MGLALEWMSVAERENLFLDLMPEANRKGRQLTGLCPFHDEKTPSFGYRPEKDHAHCFGCGWGGDLIKLYVELRGNGRDIKEVFREFKDRYGPADQQGWRQRRRRPRPRPQVYQWAPVEAGLPPELWMERAESFVGHSVERLGGLPRELARLERWGLTEAAIRAGRLGWNERWKSFKASAWGLDPGEAGEKIHLPPGLVIPLMEDGRVIRIKVRRPEPEAKPRYMQIKGGSTRLYRYGRGRKMMVVETERDALMLWGLFHHLGWAFVGTGSASARPCARLHPMLAAAEMLVISLDNDQAGVKACINFWQKTYPGAWWWPVPWVWGKDPGEAMERRHDVEGWLEACEAELRRKKI